MNKCGIVNIDDHQMTLVTKGKRNVFPGELDVF